MHIQSERLARGLKFERASAEGATLNRSDIEHAAAERVPIITQYQGAYELCPRARRAGTYLNAVSPMGQQKEQVAASDPHSHHAQYAIRGIAAAH